MIFLFSIVNNIHYNKKGKVSILAQGDTGLACGVRSLCLFGILCVLQPTCSIVCAGKEKTMNHYACRSPRELDMVHASQRSPMGKSQPILMI